MRTFKSKGDPDHFRRDIRSKIRGFFKFIRPEIHQDTIDICLFGLFSLVALSIFFLLFCSFQIVGEKICRNNDWKYYIVRGGEEIELLTQENFPDNLEHIKSVDKFGKIILDKIRGNYSIGYCSPELLNYKSNIIDSTGECLIALYISSCDPIGTGLFIECYIGLIFITTFTIIIILSWFVRMLYRYKTYRANYQQDAKV